MESQISGRTFRDIAVIIAAVLLLTFLIWLPHLLKISNLLGLDFSAGFNTVYRNFDGLEYVIIAKTFYDPTAIASLPQSLPAGYYASHFPGYALVIALFAPLLGFLKSMLFASVLFTVFSAIAFYFLVRDFKLTSQPLYLSLLFLILPARWLIVHSVGSAEPMFIFFTILTFYLFMKFEAGKNYLFVVLAALAGVGAQLTRPPGILLFLALALYIAWKILQGGSANLIRRAISIKITYAPLILIPLALLGMFYWYHLSYNDFLAYFHSGDNIHLTFPPFQVFNKLQFWVGDIWLEDIIYILLLGFLGGLFLIKQRLYPLAFFVLTYLAASSMVAHRDISRYVLPIFPFVLIAFEKVLVSKEFKIVLAIIALGIYLYAQNFIIHNTAPFPNPEIFN